MAADYQGARVLVAGCGFIGMALAREIGRLGGSVVSLVRGSANGATQSIPGMKCVSVDARDALALDRTIGAEKFDYVFNLLGYIDHSPYCSGGRSVIDGHYIATLNLLDRVYQSNLRRFVQVGSSDEYGDAPAPQREDMREAPISSYSAAKAGLTHLVEALARGEGFPGTVVRLFLVYGPGQIENRFLPQVIRGCLRNEIFPTSKGEQLRDFCFIDDVVEGLICAAQGQHSLGKTINIASGEPVRIRDVVNEVINLTGQGRPQFGAHPYRPKENMALYADIGLARQTLGWSPSTRLVDGLRLTIDWYRERGSHNLV